VVYKALTEIEGVKCQKPGGAFYIIAALPIDDADDFCQWLLTDFSIDNETAMFAPASGFYADKNSGKNEIRISYVLEEDSLIKAMNILKEALKAYK
jgi:aspartate aminotransferase